MQRVSLIHHDLMRELCDSCRRERFLFVPPGAEPVPGTCSVCGAESKLADVSDSALFRLIDGGNGDMVVVPVIAPR